MAAGQLGEGTNRGPSRALIEWRRFILETLLCLELMGAIAAVGIGASDHLIGAVGSSALITAILRVLWRRW